MKFTQKTRKLKFHKLWNSSLVMIKKDRDRLNNQSTRIDLVKFFSVSTWPKFGSSWLGRIRLDFGWVWLGRVWPNIWLGPRRPNLAGANSIKIWLKLSTNKFWLGLTWLKFDIVWLDHIRSNLAELISIEIRSSRSCSKLSCIRPNWPWMKFSQIWQNRSQKEFGRMLPKLELPEIWLNSTKLDIYEIWPNLVELTLTKLWSNWAKSTLAKFNLIGLAQNFEQIWPSRHREKFIKIRLRQPRLKFCQIWSSWPRPKFCKIWSSQQQPKFGRVNPN